MARSFRSLLRSSSLLIGDSRPKFSSSNSALSVDSLRPYVSAKRLLRFIGQQEEGDSRLRGSGVNAPTPSQIEEESKAPDAGSEHEEEDYGPFVDNETGEVGGPQGPEPTRYGDWERGGRCSDF
ncbi:hypothetical protein H6P81_014416 [Aristolochia fimbriata]|uniref:Succinate dehydrogenase assembly factor 4, mitochondrial n=1 Tax=Aristolochia fimbriata TaxID=158543 RepID=A0AAV7EHP3_ARIFI|nr:hypothetical protein H6P81_014416 [Aristolochia fimbriata]